MRGMVRTLIVTAFALSVTFGLGSSNASAQGQPPAQGQAQGQPGAAPNEYSSIEIVDAGHRFFGTVARGLAQVVEKAVSQWGLPNGYVLGEEGGGAFFGGLRYGEGVLYT